MMNTNVMGIGIYHKHSNLFSYNENLIFKVLNAIDSSINPINLNFVENRMIMGVPELRKELHNFINHADERFLKMVYAMSKEYEKSSIAGYDVDGSIIDEEQLIGRVRNASMRVKSGDYITQEELDKEVEEW